MLRWLINTRDDYATLIVRLGLAGVMIPHGAQKLLGWFGGYGFSGTMGYFTGTLGLPWILALLVILAESVGAVALAVGFLGRVGAFGIAAVMVGAIAMGHAQHGFFMNWSGRQGGEGFEYHLLALAMAAAVMLRGSGALSLDLALSRRAAPAPALDAPRGVPAAA